MWWWTTGGGGVRTIAGDKQGKTCKAKACMPFTFDISCYRDTNVYPSWSPAKCQQPNEKMKMIWGRQHLHARQWISKSQHPQARTSRHSHTGRVCPVYRVVIARIKDWKITHRNAVQQCCIGQAAPSSITWARFCPDWLRVCVVHRAEVLAHCFGGEVSLLRARAGFCPDVWWHVTTFRELLLATICGASRGRPRVLGPVRCSPCVGVDEAGGAPPEPAWPVRFSCRPAKLYPL